MLRACRGIVETVHALRSVDHDILIAHVDATDLYVVDDPSLNDEARHRQDIVFLALDLVSGRVDARHALWSWLRRNGADEQALAWFHERAVDLPLIGINLYPMFTLKHGVRTTRGALRWRMPYATAEIVEKLGAMYWQRYDAPVFVSETASVGTVRRRSEWLLDSVAAVRRLREGGVPLVGYTWWPLFALVTWGYRQGTHPPEYYLKQMGLWDLDAGLRRIATQLVDEFRALTDSGCQQVGELREVSHVS
jgi:hypothetical protein